MRQASDRSYNEACPALAALARDTRPLVQAACPLCHGTGPSCLVETLRAVAAQAAGPATSARETT